MWSASDGGRPLIVLEYRSHKLTTGRGIFKPLNWPNNRTPNFAEEAVLNLFPLAPFGIAAHLTLKKRVVITAHASTEIYGDSLMKNLVWIIVAAVIAGVAYMLYSGKSPTEMATDASEAVNAPAALESATEAAGDAVETTTETVTEAVEATTEAASDAAEAVTDAAESAVDATTDTAAAMAETAGEAVEATEEAASDAAEAVTETASDAVETATETATDSATAVNETASDAVDAAADAVDTVTETATDAATATTEAASDAGDAVTESATDAAAATTDAATATTEAATDAAAATTEATTDSAASAVEAVTETAPDATMMDKLLSVDGFDMTKVSEMIEGSDLGLLQKTTLTKGLEAAQDNPELLKSVLEKVREALNL